MLLATVLAALSCSRGAVDLSQVPTGFPVPEPESILADMEAAESYSVEIEDALFVLGRELQAKNWPALEEILTPDFLASPLPAIESATKVALPLGGIQHEFPTESSNPSPGDAFAESWQQHLGDWQEIATTRWTLPQADFQVGRPVWARTSLQLEVHGKNAAGDVASWSLAATAQMVKVQGSWRLRSFALHRLQGKSRERALFTDVSVDLGIAYREEVREDGKPFRQGATRQPFNGAACADVNGDGWWDFFFAGKLRNSLYLANGLGGFQEVAAEWGLATPADGSGCAFFDYDNDGDQDLFVASEGRREKDGSIRGQPWRMYRQDDGRFTEVGAELGLDQCMASQSVVILDYDQDGWLDIYVTNYGDRRTEDVNSWHDGDNGQADALMRNLAGKGFQDMAEEAGVALPRWSYAAAAADFDRDGDQDIYVAHDYAVNAFFRNNGDGTFVEVGAEIAAEDLGFGMGVNWADLNHDGLLDLYIANMFVPAAARIMGRLQIDANDMAMPHKLSRGNTILWQQPDGTFRLASEEIGGVNGLWAWGVAVNDFDLDGYLDVFCTNGMFTRQGIGEIHSYFWRNVVAAMLDPKEDPSIGMRADPNGSAFRQQRVRQGRAGRSWGGHERDKFWWSRQGQDFVDLSDFSGVDSAGDGRAAIAVDFDQDGDLDLLVNEWSFTEFNRQILYRNDVQAQPIGYLAIRLRATTTQYEAIGSEVVVTTPEGPLSQVLVCGHGFLSAGPPELVFGLGKHSDAEVEVFWPSGRREAFGRLSTNSQNLLVEGTGKPLPFPHSTD